MDATAERRPFSRLPAASAAFALGKSDQLTTADAGGKECGRANKMAVGWQQAAAQAGDREATGEALLRTIGHGDEALPWAHDPGSCEVFNSRRPMQRRQQDS